MHSIGPARSSRLRNAVSVLEQLLNTLPTKEEIQQIDHYLDELVIYLSDVRSLLTKIPPRDEFLGAIHTAKQLEELLERAEANPVVARTLGLEKPPPKKPQPITKVEVSESTKIIMSRLDGMSIDQVRAFLLNEVECSLVILKQLAHAYNIRIQSRWSRATIVTKIVTHLTNFRGYKSLSGQP